jgi:hypothetical protein
MLLAPRARRLVAMSVAVDPSRSTSVGPIVEIMPPLVAFRSELKRLVELNGRTVADVSFSPVRIPVARLAAAQAALSATAHYVPAGG